MDVTLASNSGDDKLVLSIASRFDWDGEPGLETSLLVVTRHWDGDHDNEIRLVIPGLCLGIEALRTLHDRLAAWLSRPLAELVTAKLTTDAPLALPPGQRLDVAFGPRADTLDGMNQTVTLLFGTTRLKGDVHFVTDQSCVRLFANGLAGALQAFAP
jgi:hypothetical protein